MHYIGQIRVVWLGDKNKHAVLFEVGLNDPGIVTGKRKQPIVFCTGIEKTIIGFCEADRLEGCAGDNSSLNRGDVIDNVFHLP